MKNYDYLYYFHNSPISSYEEIENVFNEGLKCYHGYSLDSILNAVDKKTMNSMSLQDAVKSYTSGNTCFVIKIPKDYMGMLRHRDGTLECPIPLFKQTKEKIDSNGNTINLFTPHLIRGVYDRINNVFVSNPNYTPIYNPNGLQYADEQVQNLYSLNALNWVSYAEHRRKLSFEELDKIDSQSKTFDEHLKAYANLYPHKQPFLFNGKDYYNNLNQQSNASHKKR